MRRLWLLFVPAAAYQCLAIIAAMRQRRKQGHRSRPRQFFQPGISVLKPVHGLDPNTRAAFISQVRQNYPAFEILFGVTSEHDGAIAEIERLKSAYPDAAIRLAVAKVTAANPKVGVLIELSRHARYPIWVVNDGDIKVTDTYLAEIVTPLADLDVGLVTCAYRASAHSAATAWEALGIATDFMPSALVAQLLGVRDFGFGSTLAFRAEDLEAAGGFAAVAEYLADDYQLARHLTATGKRAVLSTYVVETSLGEGTWRGVWNHQLRWARTIRVSKAGYAGLPFAHAGLWAVLAILVGARIPAAALVVLRVTSAFATGWLVLRSSVAKRFAWLAPVWDLYAFAIWLTSYAGNRVQWRDRLISIDRDGCIVASDASDSSC
ncbi:MAG: bacteriohopanetetrol glucosamine biosynthesis glycosyltransferase HpnI [Acidobacteriaceae bacterium]|nr:bacteriohopanetetrol glucosamine biosynthesis glycosyltransferase HpnI [Acidobacteriaceae bacterium]